MSRRVGWVIVLALCLAAAIAATRTAAATVRLKPDTTSARSVRLQADQFAQTAKPAANDPWNFPSDEDDKPPTIGQIVRGQALDLTLLTGFVALALVGFFRKSETLKTITLVASVAYIGFYKSALITIVNVYGLLSWNLPTIRDGFLTYVVFGFMLVSTILWGRLYCGRVCAFGALTQLMDKVVPARLRVDLPKSLERRAAYIKYGLLAAVLLIFFITRNPLAYYRYVEPFWMFSRHATLLEWTALGALLVATVFVRNLYCRFLCPLGAFLGIVSNLTVFRIPRWSECKRCKICEKACEWGAIQGPKIIVSECVRCDDCERIYADTAKCVHWLVIKKKSELMARTPPPTVPAGM